MFYSCARPHLAWRSQVLIQPSICSPPRACLRQRRALGLCPHRGRAAVSPAEEKKLENWAWQQSSSPCCSTPVTIEQSQLQSKSCFHLLDRSCKDAVCLTEPTVSSNLMLCPGGRRGNVRAVTGCVSLLSSLSLSRIFMFFLFFSPFHFLVYHSPSHAHSCTSLAADNIVAAIARGRK